MRMICNSKRHGMRGWFKRRRHERAERRRVADLKAMSLEQRAAALAGAEGAGWIEAAAVYGLVEAQVLWGQSLLGSDPALAFRWFSGAAAAGYPPALNMLGRCLEKGWGTAIDLSAASVRYRDAAETGCDWAQYNLANLLLYGLGVRKDRIEAYAWYGQAAAQGHAKAMNMLGRFHEEGWDRPRDLAQAIFWYQSAAYGGDYRGQFNLSTILAQRGAARGLGLVCGRPGIGRSRLPVGGSRTPRATR